MSIRRSTWRAIALLVAPVLGAGGCATSEVAAPVQVVDRSEPSAVASKQPAAQPGATAQGMLAALEFGQVPPDTLRRLSRLGPLRLTPWRMLLVQGARTLPDLPGVILDPQDPRLRLRACGDEGGQSDSGKRH